MVASFTRAAATELRERNPGLAKGAIGTLHSHCYRALGCPEIAESPYQGMEQTYPHLRLTPGDSDVEELDPEISCLTPADVLYTKMNHYGGAGTCDPVARIGPADSTPFGMGGKAGAGSPISPTCWRSLLAILRQPPANRT